MFEKMIVPTTGKLGGCYFSLVLFSKSALRLILKYNIYAYERNRLISPSYFKISQHTRYKKNFMNKIIICIFALVKLCPIG
jgi:hypothetical protein